jgi:hypothetical protein
MDESEIVSKLKLEDLVNEFRTPCRVVRIN